MINLSWFPSMAAVTMIFSLAQPQPPLQTDHCALVESSAAFTGKIVVVRARLEPLRGGEWGIDDTCFRPTLLALPRDVSPRPDFETQVSAGLRMLETYQRQPRGLFRADFVGRFDVAGVTSSRSERETFGKSRVETRLVLKEVLNAEVLPMPKK
jgi:hypothetical protein